MPIAVDAVACDWANLEGTEGGGPEKFHGVENGEDRLGVLHGEVAVFEAEQDSKGFIGRGDFNFLGRGKSFGRLRLQKKVEASVLRKFFLAAEANRGGR